MYVYTYIYIVGYYDLYTVGYYDWSITILIYLLLPKIEITIIQDNYSNHDFITLKKEEKKLSCHRQYSKLVLYIYHNI